MTESNSTQPTSTKVTRSSLADIASRLETNIGHLESMIKLSHRNADDEALILSLLDSIDKYAKEISSANKDLYKEAWKLPNETSAEVQS
jgi:hypothetical protein